MRGIPGALVCVVGVLAVGAADDCGGNRLSSRLWALPERHGVLAGLAAAAARVMIAAAVKTAEPLIRVGPGPSSRGARGICCHPVLHFSLPLVLLVTVPASIGFACRRADEK